MRTDDLINMLTKDPTPPRRLRSVTAVAIGGGILVSAALFFLALGFRPDILEAIRSWRFLFKFVVTISLAVTAMASIVQLGRPGGSASSRGILLALAPVLLLGAVAVELAALPSGQWLSSLIGHNARFCLTLIPLLAIGPLACILLALRQGAPASPGLAGAVAGLVASGIAATFYAANCEDDSPLFVMTWYPLATLIVTSAGFAIGRKLLRW